MNKSLLKKIDIFLNKVEFTEYVKLQLKELLLRYEYCQKKRILHYPYNLTEIKVNEFNKHLIGFLDGDGILRSGQRIGHKKGLYRFAPNIGLDLIKYDLDYLKLIKKMLNLSEDKKIYSTDNKVTLLLSSKKELEIIMNILDNDQPFISQKRTRDYKLLKKLLEYLDFTKLNKKDEIWKDKGLEIIKDLNTFNNLSSDEDMLNHLKNNINLDYILGFIEAEGSFILHYNTKKDNIFNSFEITQNKVNDLILWEILNFIKKNNNPLIIKENVEIKTKGIVEDKSKSRKQPLSRLILTNNEVLFYKIIPLMVSKNFYTKKQINLVYWIFGVIICYKLKNIDECKDLYFKLKEKINSNNNELLDLNVILDILNKYL